MTEPDSVSRLLADLPDVLGPWPRTPVTVTAVHFIDEHEPAYLVHHSIRSYFYGRRLGELQNLHPGEDYDDEAMFLSAVLHDIGLVEEANRSQRFEVDGADRAAQFVREQGLDDDVVETVWDAVALHTSAGIVNRKRPEIALPAAGIAADLFAYNAAALEPGFIKAAHDRYPRDDLGNRLTRQIADQVEQNPAKLVPFTFTAAAVHRWSPDIPLPSLTEMTAKAFRESSS